MLAAKQCVASEKLSQVEDAQAPTIGHVFICCLLESNQPVYLIPWTSVGTEIKYHIKLLWIEISMNCIFDIIIPIIIILIWLEEVYFNNS